MAVLSARQVFGEHIVKAAVEQGLVARAVVDAFGALAALADGRLGEDRIVLGQAIDARRHEAQRLQAVVGQVLVAAEPCRRRIGYGGRGVQALAGLGQQRDHAVVRRQHDVDAPLRDQCIERIEQAGGIAGIGLDTAVAGVDKLTVVVHRRGAV